MGRLRALVFGLLVIGTLAFAVQAGLANHLLGRTYTGTFTAGGGGTVTFTVSASGQVTFTHDRTGTCAQRTFPSVAVTTNHTFAAGASAVSQVSGTFPASGNASGTLSSNPSGTACDLRSVTWTASAQATPSPDPTRTPSTPIPTRTPTRGTLPNNGAPTAVIALSGLSLLELGVGLRVLSKRLQRPWLSVPAYLLHRLVRAQRRGADGVRVAQDWYLVRRRPEDRPPPD